MKCRRRRLLVDGPLQARIVAAVSWPAAVGLATSLAAVVMFFVNVTRQAMDADVQLSGLTSMLLITIGFIVASASYFMFNCLKVSHRVAGPIHRIQKTLRDVREGNTSLRSSVRTDDFLGEVSDSINEFLDWAQEYLPRETGVESPDTAMADSEAPDEAAADRVAVSVDSVL